MTFIDVNFFREILKIQACTRSPTFLPILKNIVKRKQFSRINDLEYFSKFSNEAKLIIANMLSYPRIGNMTKEPTNRSEKNKRYTGSLENKREPFSFDYMDTN